MDSQKLQPLEQLKTSEYISVRGTSRNGAVKLTPLNQSECVLDVRHKFLGDLKHAHLQQQMRGSHPIEDGGLIPGSKG